MTFLLIAYSGGVLTVLSPCILPVLPFVFSRTGRSFFGSTLPMLAGMACAFAAVATLAAVGGDWAATANEYGRDGALALLTVFGITLLSPWAAAVLTRPFTAFGNRLLNSAGAPGPALTVGSSLLQGVATGMLWAPCAGPILGLILTGAVLRGANAQTTLLLFAYAAGAATSLAFALLIGGRVLAAMRRALGAGDWLRRGLGVAVLCGVAAIGLGTDTGLPARLSGSSTDSFEQAVLDRFASPDPKPAPDRAGRPILEAAMVRPATHLTLPAEGAFPSLGGAVDWLNSPPLTPEQLRGKVVLVNFWTYSCINCIRTIPYVRAWAEKYRDQGLVVIGVHTPEFSFERNVKNVKGAIDDFKIDFPVAVDSDYKIWRAFENSYWPARYVIDASGEIRFHQFGEGGYDKAERVIQALLADAGSLKAVSDTVTPHPTGIEAAPDFRHIQSNETYLGYNEGSGFASPETLKRDAARDYTTTELALNTWGLSGNWTVRAEQATLNQPGGGIAYRFSARDLHLVLGPGIDGRPIRFQVKLDGMAPGDSHGADTDADGNGIVTETRLYQLARQTGGVGERMFEIRFLDPGVEAFVFTFG